MKVSKSDNLPHDDRSPDVLVLPVGRRTGLWTAAPYFCIGLLLILPLPMRWPSLRFVPTTFSNRITDYSWAILLLALAAVGAFLLLTGLRWLLLSVWPAKLQVVADQHALSLQLGPFGRLDLAWDRMTIQYAFETSPEAEEPLLDGLLEPEEEIRTHLPRITHPDVPSAHINVLLLRFARDPEPELAGKLWPFIHEARSRQGRPVKLDQDQH